MKKITLDDVIKENQDSDAEFAAYYQKELLINAISKMIVKLRKQAHLTQGELAKRAGTTQPVIARLESGVDTRMPSLDLIARIAAASNAHLVLNFEMN
jgi:DNA-binding XRE family transcriptional regulator